MSAIGHVYMQTNESQNRVIHYVRGEGGALTEVERSPTGASGAGTFNYRANPLALIVDGAQGLLLTRDRRFLFAVNAGDNSVSSFGIEAEGKLRLLDVKRTGNIVIGRSGTVKSLAYSPTSGTLYVLHTIGPHHVRMMSVDNEGMLTVCPEGYTAAPPDKPGRVVTMLTLSPDERFLLVGCSLDELPGANPDGSPIVWVKRNEKPHSIFANAPDPDGLAVFPVDEHGGLCEPMFQDAGASSPWCTMFLKNRRNQFVIGFATADGLSLATLESDGKVATGPVVQADTSMGKGSGLCWMAITPDDQLLFATMTGYGYITSWRLDRNALSIAKDPACPKVAGDGTFRGLGGIVGAAPNDMWMTPDGAYLYQIYPNASKLIGYAVQPDGGLVEVTSADIPYNSPQSLAGF
jgi:6-phosphogluconolactonase (cycloisomerase 2 family)